MPSERVRVGLDEIQTISHNIGNNRRSTTTGANRWQRFLPTGITAVAARPFRRGGPENGFSASVAGTIRKRRWRSKTAR